MILMVSSGLISGPKTTVNLLTPRGDHDRISPYSFNPIFIRQMMRIKKNTN